MKKQVLGFVSVSALLLFHNGCGASANRNMGTSAPPRATHFSVIAPAIAASGRSFAFPLSALDGSNNVVTTYAGTVQFTSTDPQAVLPPGTAITSGAGSFFATMTQLGPQSITATDTTTSLSGESGLVNVLATGTFVITSGQPPDGGVGTPYGGFQQICVTGMIQGFRLEAFGGGSGAVANRGGPSLDWSSSTLPPGLQLDSIKLGGPPDCPHGRVEVINGTPTKAGTFTFTLTASTSTEAASATYTIRIVHLPGK